VEVCNNIVTEAANTVLMFEAGEQAALSIKTLKIEDINREFEKDGITTSFEISEKKIIFHVKGLRLSGKKCRYCDILRGFLEEYQGNISMRGFTAKKAASVSLRAQMNASLLRSW